MQLAGLLRYIILWRRIIIIVKLGLFFHPSSVLSQDSLNLCSALLFLRINPRSIVFTTHCLSMLAFRNELSRRPQDVSATTLCSSLICCAGKHQRTYTSLSRRAIALSQKPNARLQRLYSGAKSRNARPELAKVTVAISGNQRLYQSSSKVSKNLCGHPRSFAR